MDYNPPNERYGMAKAKASKQIQVLLSPELLSKAQEEAKLQGISLEDFIRTVLDRYLKALSVAREQQEAQSREYARSLLRAHFAEDRNEFLTGDDVRIIGGKTPPTISKSKSH